MKQMILKKGREKSVLRRHPWIFSGAVESITGDPENGEAVTVADWRGRPLAVASWSRESQISGRIWSFEPGCVIDGDFFSARIKAAFDYRKSLALDNVTAFRCIASEADGMPGVIADYYDGWLVVQYLAMSGEYYAPVINSIFRKFAAAQGWHGIYERSDADIRKREGLELRKRCIMGDYPPEKVEVSEGRLKFFVDIRRGHKTGFYCDQRDNRSKVFAGVKPGNRVLNVFSYTGGFGVAAAVGGAAEVVNIDSSLPALEAAGANMELNGIDPDRYSNIAGDAFELLRQLAAERPASFDVIILDPPKLVDRAGALMKGARAYKDLAIQAFRLLAPGGRLFTFSCSGLMTRELFEKITFEAALDAGVFANIVQHLAQAPDHPVPLNYPEAFYLKGLEVVLCS